VRIRAAAATAVAQLNWACVKAGSEQYVLHSYTEDPGQFAVNSLKLR